LPRTILVLSLYKSEITAILARGRIKTYRGYHPEGERYQG
jgi:hypothetical protein